MTVRSTSGGEKLVRRAGMYCRGRITSPIADHQTWRAILVMLLIIWPGKGGRGSFILCSFELSFAMSMREVSVWCEVGDFIKIIPYYYHPYCILMSWSPTRTKFIVFRHTKTSTFKIVCILTEVTLNILETTMAEYRKGRDYCIGRGYITEAR